MLSHSSQHRSGLTYAALAFITWGLFPVYWKFLNHVSSLEILAHRILWSAGFVALLLVWRKRVAWFKPLKSAKTLLILLSCSGFIGFNWWLYIWAVNSGQIIETSMGYYINPLVSVAFGVLFLRERLVLLQWLAVVLAAAGVLWMVIGYGQFPWIALTLASSFAIYGLLKKLSPLDPLISLFLETLILVPVSLLWLTSSGLNGTLVALHSGWGTDVLLILGGVVTALPLYWFAEAVRRIPLYLIGFMQYIGPTLALLLGVFVYHEPFTSSHMVSFSLIWLALILFSGSLVKGFLKQGSL